MFIKTRTLILIAILVTPVPLVSTYICVHDIYIHKHANDTLKPLPNDLKKLGQEYISTKDKVKK